MPSQQNIGLFEQIQNKKAVAKSVVFTNYSGMNASQLNELRQKVRDSKGELLVTKNTLLRIAFGLEKDLVGPIATIFSYEDEVAPIKVVADFNKENSLPKLVGGYLVDHALGEAQVMQLSQLPSKDQLRGQLVGMLAAPLTGTLNVLQGNLRKLVYALNAIKEQKAN